jgi:large subunit ribosomal protein L20
MARIKRSVASRKRRKKIIDMASGYRGRSGNCYKLAKQAIARAGQFAYRDRRARKRDMRGLWIIRINAAVRLMGIKYSEFIDAITKTETTANRKIMSDLAYTNPEAFTSFVNGVMLKYKEIKVQA